MGHTQEWVCPKNLYKIPSQEAYRRLKIADSKQSLQMKLKVKTHQEIENGLKSSVASSPKSSGGLQMIEGFLGEKFLNDDKENNACTPIPI